MAVVKRSVSIDSVLWERLQAIAGAENVSGVVNEALSSWLIRAEGLAAMGEYEAEHGAFTAEETAAADAFVEAALSGHLDWTPRRPGTKKGRAAAPGTSGKRPVVIDRKAPAAARKARDGAPAGARRA